MTVLIPHENPDYQEDDMGRAATNETSPKTIEHAVALNSEPTNSEVRQIELVATDDTVPPTVLWQKEHREFTDKIGAVIYILCYVVFLITGFFMVAKAKPRFEWDTATGERYVSQYYQDEVKTCCQEAGGTSSFYDLCNQLEPTDSRRLKAGNSNFDGDEGIFDAFIEAPWTIIVLLSLAIVLAILWIFLIRMFATPIIFLTELIKMVAFIVIGVKSGSNETLIFCIVVAVAILAYDIWARKELIFAGQILSHASLALKENWMMFLGLIVVVLFYALNAGLFVLFFSKGFENAQVQRLDLCFESFYGDKNCDSICEFTYPKYLSGIYTFQSLAYLWTVMLFSKMRLSIISFIVGSWRFHPDNKPSIITAVTNTLTTSMGTLSIASLISTIAEYINRKLTEPCWTRAFGFIFCCIIFVPLELFWCMLGSCCSMVIKMLTKFAVILHVFTGLPFIGSGKKVFKIMSRHFKQGFVTEVSSKSVLNLGCYVFSIGFALLAWASFDSHFKTETLVPTKDKLFFILWIIFGLFNLWYPVLGIYIIILVNRVLRLMERTNYETGGENYQHIWVSPLAAIFVGCLAMMFFTYLAGIFMDTVDVLFLCFAIEKDNNVDISSDELNLLIKTVPGYMETVAYRRPDENASADADEELDNTGKV